MAEEENLCPFLWIFEIIGLCLRSVFQHSNVGNTQQSGTRIHSCYYQYLRITSDYVTRKENIQMR